MTEQAIIIIDNEDAQSFYLQEIVNTAKQITDAGVLKRIYLLARRLLGKQTGACPEPPPAEHISPREADMTNLLRYAGGLTDRHLHLTTVAARTYAAIEYEAGQEPAEPKSWADRACALLPKLTPKDQEGIYWLIEWKVTCGIDVAKCGHRDDSATRILKVLVNDEMEGVVKPKTLDAILTYVQFVKRREGKA